MSIIDWEAFGPNVDLCVIENAYLEEAMEYEEILVEAGAIINKARLSDEKYIKDLIKDIKDGKAKYNWGSMFIAVVGGATSGFAASAFPFTIALPFIMLCNTILTGFIAGWTRAQVQDKSTTKVLANINKMINKSEKTLLNMEDKDEKAAMKKQIEKLKNNKKLILEKLK